VVAVAVEDDDIAAAGVRSEAAGHGQRLHHRGAVAEDQFARLVDLANDIHHMAQGRLDGHRHRIVGNEGGEAGLQIGLQGGEGHAAGRNAAHQGELQAAVRQDQNLAVEAVLFPHGNLQHIAGIDGVDILSSLG